MKDSGSLEFGSFKLSLAVVIINDIELPEITCPSGLYLKENDYVRGFRIM